MTCLEGPSLRLRPASPDDAAARFSLGNNSDIVRMFGVSHSDTKPDDNGCGESVGSRPRDQPLRLDY